MKKIAFAAILCIASAAQADEILFHLESYHQEKSYTETTTWVNKDGYVVKVTKQEVNYNNTNQGLGYQWDSGVAVGYYTNSYRDTTFYLVDEFMLTKHFGFLVGGVTGYEKEMGHKFSPMGAFEYKMPLDKTYTANVLFIPPFGKMSGVAHLLISKKFAGLGY